MNRKAAVWFILVTVLIDVMGFSIVIPILPELIRSLTHCTWGKASLYGAYLLMVFAFLQFICSPIAGNLSDRYGRRPVLLIALLGFSLDYVFQGLAPSLTWLFVGRAIAGMTGASYTTASAYIADVSTNENRAQNFGLIGVAFGLGFVVGPFLSGELATFGLRVPFFVAAGLCLLNTLFGLFVLPESLPPEKRRPWSWKRANPIGAVAALGRYPALVGMFVSVFFLYIAAYAVQGTWTYYNYLKFNWTPQMMGYSLAVVGLLVALVQGVLIRFTIPRLGPERSVYTGMLLGLVGFVLFAFASQGWMMLVFLIPYCLSGLAGPSLQSIMSGRVGPDEQGELQGMLTCLASLTMIIAPLLMGGLFSYFTTRGGPIYFPGAPFLAGAVFIILSVVVAWRTLRSRPARVV